MFRRNRDDFVFRVFFRLHYLGRLRHHCLC